MKIKKTIEIEETICDVCEITNDRTFMNNCFICGKDICTRHTYLITSLGASAVVGKLCPDCFNERLKIKNEDTPKVNINIPKRMPSPYKTDEDCPKEHWLFGGEE